MPAVPAAQNTESPAARQVARAKILERDRAELMKKISSNREYLRLMAENNELTDDQEDWLDAFYPVKERGEQRSAEEVERTRKAKAAARDGGA